MSRIALCVVTLAFLQAPAAPLLSEAARAAADRITAGQLSKDLEFLASDELRGRNTPSPGFDKAAAYIVQRLERAGLKPLGDDGTFYQRYVMRESRVDTAAARLEIGGRSFPFGEAFVLRSFAGPVTGTYPVAYIQHGWTVTSRGVDPFAGVDVKGKVVVAHGPRAMPKGIDIRQIGRINVDAVAAVDEAKRRGAVALLYVPHGTALNNWEQGRNTSLSRRELEPSVPSAYAAPALTSALLSRAAAEALFDGERIAGAELMKLAEGGDYPAPFQLQKTVTLHIPTASSVDHRPYNVVALLEGSDPVLRNEYITSESHLDGAVGSRTIDGDNIYNSADDNATGSAGNLAIAEQMAKARPKRSIIFIWDSGEEQGLWGTRHFVGNPPVPLDRIVAHFNIDMIGATRAPGTADADSKEATGPNEVFVVGPGVLSKTADALIERANAEYSKMTLNRTLDRADNEFFYPRTDAGPFLERGILTINFFTGLHPRYHQPADEAKYLDPKKMEAVTRMAFASIWALANAPERPRIEQPLPPTVPNYRPPSSIDPVPPPTTILRNGTVIDGSGLPPYRADILIRGDRIARIGNLRHFKADRDIDLTGLYVAPGFINIHSHASVSALPRAENMLTQGVTTEILNADGGGAVDLAAQRARLGGALAVNVGAYIGFNATWSNVVGPDDRRPTEAEIERMRAVIVEGMKAGAWGVSAGLDYKPAYFATTDDVVRVVSAAAPWRTNFTNHDRVTPETNFSSRAGIEETLEIAEAAGLVGVVTHMKVTGAERGTARRALNAIAAATKRGHYAAADAYPYLAGATGLGALIIPAWAQDGGRPAMLKRFADPQLRPKIVAEAEQIVAARFGDASSIYLPATKRQLTDVMAEMQVGMGEAIVRLLEESSPGAILRFGLEADLREILAFPATSIACDCGATTSTATHPRNYGSYPRVLGKYVREDKVLTWQDAVRKMTALPAATIGMVDRGYLAPGMAADIAVFDPKTIIDRATYEQSALLSEGMRHVFVNGVHALRDGAVTGEQGGRALVREDGVVSRPMTRNRPRSLTVRARGEGLELTLNLSQPAGARQARGTFSLRKDGRRTAAGALGVLQVAPGWATVTTEHLRLAVDRDGALTLWQGSEPPMTLTAASVRIDAPRGR